MGYLIPILVFFWIVVVGVTRARFKVLENERLVVFRLGHPVGIREPGRVMLVPYLESGVKYNISDSFDAKLIADYQARFDNRQES
jgi:regulator of protease activity HflC (stomatin/prohibitin superfamily)